MVVPATLEQIIDYLTYDGQQVIIKGKYNERLFERYELDSILSTIYEADVIGIEVLDNVLILKLDDSYGDIDTLLEEPFGDN